MFIQEERYERKHIRTPASPAGAVPVPGGGAGGVAVRPGPGGPDDQENGGVAGVAPDAQIFAMQVFGSI